MEGRMSIPVKVSGNPSANSGWSILIGLNNPNFENDDISYPGFENCPYFFYIKTDDKQTIYKLIKNGVRSYGASRGGSLIIAFSIPYEFKLEGGKTPYDVLCRFKDEFLKMGMTAQSDDVYQYAFDSQSAYTHIFDNVVTEFSLVRETAVRHYPMTGSKTGLIVRPEEEIKKFFEDITYPEFAGYSEILVATQCSSPNYSSFNITIPRPKIYEVYVDGGLPKKVANINEPISVTSSQDLKYYENKPTTFTIARLLGGTQIKGVRIDRIFERVYVNTKELEAVERTEFVDVDIRPADKRGRIDMSRLVLDSNGTKLNLQNGKIFLRGRGIDIHSQQSHINAYYQGEDLEAKWEGVRLVIYVKEKPQPAYPPHVNNGGLNGVQSHIASEPCVEITISLEKEFFKKEARDSKFLVKLRDGREKENIGFQRVVCFNKTQNGYIGEPINVVKSQCDGVELVIEGKKKILSRNISPGNKQKLDLSQKNFEEQKKPTDSKVYLCLIIALVMFILGCAVGYFLLANNNGITFNNKTAFFTDAKLKLESVDLTIERIDSIYDIYSNKVKCQERHADICREIEQYHILSEGIKGGSIQMISGCIESNYISDVHIGFINRIVRDEQSKEWFGEKRYQEIVNLRDIEKIYEHYCDDCKKYFKDEGTKNNHKNIKCTWSGKNGMCQEKFCTQASLKKHQEDARHKSQPQGKTSSSGETYTCTKCTPNETFKNEDEYKKHMENHGVRL